ncbi:cold shock domain-containing protein [Fructilactobacillus fructivorans]|uniref:cold-shock protein n=1 Tax=Fructilactobacillus fructivorans TaxID=1614 RepID=UPI00070ECC27|nr:cold shock domain-containing protein [Fructilactobacillus fructivorans]KRN39572.1 hypothetical protein IV51_GL000939 [Fructilactobacillus fructivorans]
MKGTIKSYERDKGFGYIQVPNSDNVFMHITGIISGNPKQIKAGDSVDFVKAMGQHGFQAAKVVLHQD